MKDIKEMGLKETFCSLPNRLITLLWKMLSIKFFGFIMSIWLIWTDKVDGWYAVVVFLFSFLFLVLGREALKWIEALKGLK